MNDVGPGNHVRRVSAYAGEAFDMGYAAGPEAENPHPTGTALWSLWELGAQQALEQQEPAEGEFGITWPEPYPGRSPYPGNR